MTHPSRSDTEFRPIVEDSINSFRHSTSGGYSRTTDLIEIPPKRMKPIMLLLTGLAFGFCARMPGLRQQNGGDFVMVGVMFAIPAVIWLFRQKTEYAVLICTAAHETEAYVTYNLKIAEDIVSAINKATSDRG